MDRAFICTLGDSLDHILVGRCDRIEYLLQFWVPGSRFCPILKSIFVNSYMIAFVEFLLDFPAFMDPRAKELLGILPSVVLIDSVLDDSDRHAFVFVLLVDVL